jgi:signal peptidase I
MSTRPYPLVAVAASLIMPGLGQLYAGRPLRGLAWLASVSLLPGWICQLALWSPGHALAWLVALGVLGCLVVYVLAARDAWKLAKHPPAERAPWQRPWVYVLAVAVAYPFVLIPLTAHAREDWLETFVAPTASMLPTIVPGDRFLADKRVNRLGGVALARGDVALFVYPDNRTQVFVKRIIGLPGDRIELRGRDVWVNGRSISRGSVVDLGDPIRNKLLETHVAIAEQGDGQGYAVLWRKEGEAPQASFVVPSGQVFVLGDNRDGSLDSRRFGTVPIADVKGTAKQVLFSFSPSEGMRWRRIGRWLD